MRPFTFASRIPPEKLHGLAFDAAVLAGNIALLGALPDPELDSSERAIGFLLLGAVLTQIAGALLKGGPLRQRLAARAPAAEGGCAAGLLKTLLFLHFLLFGITALMGFGLTGVTDLGSPNAAEDLWPGVALAVAAVTTGVVWRASTRRAKDAEARPPWPGQEIVADLLLWISVSLTTRYFWQMLVALSESSRGVGLSGRGIVLLVSLSLLFVVFYLPSRYLFLVEDHRSPLTWVQAWAVMLPVAWFIVAG